MKNKIFGLATAITLSMLAAGGLWAQAVPGDFVSPQGTATHQLLRSDADNFIRPDSYTGVSLENWYGMASFSSTTLATLGFAAKAGGFYLSAFYNGSFWANVTTPEYTERYGNWLGNNQTRRVYDATPGLGADRPNNTIALLLGFADMGFRLSFRSTHESFKDKDFVVASTNPFFDDVYYKSYQRDIGNIIPQLAWGMSKNLTSKGIKPWLTFDLAFNRDYRKTAAYTQDGGSWVANERIGRSQNSIAPELNVGLGGFTLVEKNGWRTSVDLAYRLRIWAYNNEYNYTDGNGNNQIKRYKGYYDASSPSFSELSESDHRIRPFVVTQWNGEKLRLRARLDLNLLFGGKRDNELELYDYSGSLRRDGTSSKESSFTFNPDIMLAAQWQIIPKLALNVGGRVNIGRLTVTTEKSEEYEDGVKTPFDDEKRTSTSFGSTAASLALGVTVNATDNFGIEATAGASNTLPGNSVNFFNTNSGVFVFGSILVSLKF